MAPKKPKHETPAATQPPPSPLPDYERGMLDALRIIKQARDDMEAPIKRVRDEVGAAYVVLNGATHWGQTVVSEAEGRIMRHLISRRDGPASPGEGA